MQTSDTHTSKLTFQGMMAQVALYLSRVAHFPFHWGLTDDAPIKDAMRPRLFRYDARRLSRLIDMAEHMIRCLIIWLAYRKMRDETVTPRRHFIPTPPPPGARLAQDPIDHRLAARCVPLFDPKPPPFCISMPEDRSSLHALSPHQTGAEPVSDLTDHERQIREFELAMRDEECGAPRSGKLRNDDILTNERLYMRLDRLDQLYDGIDQRAARLAARWAGQVSPVVIPYAPQHASDAAQIRDPEHPPPQNTGSAGRQFPSFKAPDDTQDIRPPCPIKTYDPPQDWLDLARPDEAEDLLILHDAALRAAEGFPALCG